MGDDNDPRKRRFYNLALYPNYQDRLTFKKTQRALENMYAESVQKDECEYCFMNLMTFFLWSLHINGHLTF